MSYAWVKRKNHSRGHREKQVQGLIHRKEKQVKGLERSLSFFRYGEGKMKELYLVYIDDILKGYIEIILYTKRRVLLTHVI